ncbi:restriction endonuclease subunit S [Mucilaginibacter sp. HC2]|nr:restriction endonuclease subunit S [Mucilaginibacter inviolabilis]
MANVPNLRFQEFEGDWEKKNLGDVADISRGKSKHRPRDAAFLYGGKYPFIQTGDVKSAGLYLYKYTQTYSDAGLKQSKLWNENTLCITIAANIAETTILKIKACFPDSIIGLIPYKNKASVFFIKHQFDKFKVDVQKLSQGIAQANLNQEKLSNIQFWFPSLVEQQKIASFLSLIDQRIETQNKIIEELESLNSCLLERIFSKQLRFTNAEGRSYEEWRAMTLGDIGDVKMCRRIFNQETAVIGEIPFFKIGSFGKTADAYITRELFEDYKKRFSFPKKGDVLISAAGTIGRITVYTGEDAYFQDSNIVWIDNDESIVINDFLFYVLKIVKYNTEGGTIQRLYNNILKSTKFSCPCLHEQREIANFFSRLYQKIEVEKTVLKGYEKQKQYLLLNIFI